LHDAVLFVCVQPEVGLQPSSVQTSLSLQLGGGPPTHVPPLQASAVVQASLSLHGSVLFRCRQALAKQTSSVHGLASSQSGSMVHSIAVPARALRKSQMAGNG